MELSDEESESASGDPMIRVLESDDDLGLAWPVVQQLRPHLDLQGFVAAVATQRREGFRCAGLFHEGRCVAFAGYRVQTMLAHGRFQYVDDLVTDEAVRGKGHGARLLDWLFDEARAAGCAGLQLDSGTHRQEAHAFYFGRGLRVNAFHFIRKL